jgi:hypothetical protein
MKWPLLAILGAIACAPAAADFTGSDLPAIADTGTQVPVGGDRIWDRLLFPGAIASLEEAERDPTHLPGFTSDDGLTFRMSNDARTRSEEITLNRNHRVLSLRAVGVLAREGIYTQTISRTGSRMDYQPLSNVSTPLDAKLDQELADRATRNGWPFIFDISEPVRNPLRVRARLERSSPPFTCGGQAPDSFKCVLGQVFRQTVELINATNTKGPSFKVTTEFDHHVAGVQVLLTQTISFLYLEQKLENTVVRTYRRDDALQGFGP